MLSLKSIFRFLLLPVLACFVGCQRNSSPTSPTTPDNPPPGETQGHNGGRDSDVGVGGGAVTFYLRHGDWSPRIGTPATSYCAPVGDLSIAYLYGFDGTIPDPLFKNQTRWTMRILTQKSSIDLRGGPDLCGPKTGPGVLISLDAAARQRPGIGFYPTELASKQHNRRFRDTADAACRQDEDSCERMTSLEVNGTTYKCDTQNCWIFIGNSRSGTRSGSLAVDSTKP